MSYRPVRVEPHGKEPRGFNSIDAAMRYIMDSRIRHWSMFDDNGFVMASDNTFIPAIDGNRNAA